MKHSAQEGSAPDTLDTKITIPITAVIDREFKRRGVFPELRLEMATKVINGATGKHLVSLERAREIADLVNSRHDKVKQSIERLAERAVIQLPPMGEVKNHLGQTVQEYNLCKRDSLIVVAQLCPEFTAVIVDRWQELEAQMQAPALNPANWSRMQLIELAMQAEQERLVLAEKIEEMLPKANGFDLIAGIDGSLCMTDAAKELQIKPKQLITWLSCNEWIYKRAGSATWIGYHDKIQQGLIEMKAAIYQNSAGEDCQRPQVRITGKGLAKLAKQFATDING